VFNPAFDVTPADLVTGWVLDTGVYDRDGIVAAIAANNQREFATA
jgi:methylthioribose-1-phosphate isomerase